MDTEKSKKENWNEHPMQINEPEQNAFYEPRTRLEKWLVGIACATFFPLVYLIGRAIIYLFS